jgi:hypothetical protein
MSAAQLGSSTAYIGAITSSAVIAFDNVATVVSAFEWFEQREVKL